jgi:hypothetical protein
MRHHQNNIRRANAASRALDAYRLANRNHVEDGSLCDLLTDLGHFADQHGIAFPAIVACALRDWAAERETKEKPKLAVRLHVGEGGER